MKKYMMYFVIAILMFVFGFAFSNFVNVQNLKDKPRVTGIGGIFFKSKKPKELKDWYKNNLGLQIDEYGTNFEWFEGIDYTKKASTQWSIFGAKSKYMLPSTKDFMINYRVYKLDELLVNLKNNNVTILDSIESYDYGRFVHIMDIDGNKIELWEPIDEEYEKIKIGRTK